MPDSDTDSESAIVVDTWDEQHSVLWSTLATIDLNSVQLYNVARKLLAHDVSELRLEYLRRLHGEETNGVTRELGETISKLRELLKKTHLPEGYYRGRILKGIRAKEDLNYHHQVMAGILIDAVFGDAEPWLMLLGKVPESEANIGRQIRKNIQERLQAHAKQKSIRQTGRQDEDTQEQEGPGEENPEDH